MPPEHVKVYGSPLSQDEQRRRPGIVVQVVPRAEPRDPGAIGCCSSELDRAAGAHQYSGWNDGPPAPRLAHEGQPFSDGEHQHGDDRHEKA
jgi:hypothetical protein